MKKTTRTLALACALTGGIVAVSQLPRVIHPQASGPAPTGTMPATTPSGVSPESATTSRDLPAADGPGAASADAPMSAPVPVNDTGRSLFADLGSLAKDRRISLPVAGGELAGRVNYVNRYPNGAIAAGGVLEDGSGTFEIAQEPWGYRGLILQPGLRIGHAYAGNGGELTVSREPIGNLVCDPMPKPDDQPAASPDTMGEGVAASAIYNGGESVGILSDPVPILHSRPSAVPVIYLDLDGQVVEGTSWAGGGRIVAKSHNLSAATMTDMWKRVAEDYAPFDVNVTTDLQAYLKAPQGRRVRCIVSQNGPNSGSAGGVAYGSFTWSGDTPCWAYYTGKTGAEVISHEVGHTLGLGHDGADPTKDDYYGGYGSGETGWAPIMGVSYYKELTQWSKGDYPGADNLQDDITIISGKTPVRADDHSAFASDATPLMIDGSGNVSASGVIQSRDDVDAFIFTTGGGSVTLNFNRFETGPNLDIDARLYDSTGALVASSNPYGDLDASITATLTAGVYTVTVDGVGQDTWTTSGYDDYDSLGQFTITGTVPFPGWRFRVAVSSLAGTKAGTVAPGSGSAYSITGGNTGTAFAIDATTGALSVATPSALAGQRVFNLTVAYTAGGSPVTATVPVTIAPDRGLKRDVWTGITGTTVANLTSNAAYPNSPASTGPIEIFETPLNIAENYGQRVTGYLIPPTTGSYNFWVASDDSSELWLSTDENPSNRVKIASVSGSTGSRVWTKYPSQASAAIALVGGQRYFIEAIMKEGAGNDNLAVAWQGPGIAQAVIPNSSLEYPGARPNRAPVLTNSTFRVVENATTGTTVGTLLASDSEAGSSLTYSITAGNTGSAFALNASTGVLTVNGALSFAALPEYTLTIQATDPGGLSSTADIIVDVLPLAVKRQVWTGVTGTAVTNLTSLAAYPNSPNTTDYRTIFESPVNSGDNYGQRLSGYLRAPDSGTYTFWIASDDTSELWLSTDSNPANKVKIASVTGYTGSRVWTTYASQKSAAITLEGGKFYYIEALHKEGTGGDNLAVSWSGPDFGQSMLGAPFVTQQTYNHGGPMLDDKTVTATDLSTTVTTLEAKDWSDPGTTLTYSITAGNVDGAFAINPATGTITAAVSPLPLGTRALTVNVSDNGPTPLSDTANITVTVQRAVLKRELWTGLEGGTIVELTGSSAYAGTPNVTDYLASADFNGYGDNYGDRISGWFTPTASGSYFFYVASDDASELWLSSNSDPANKVKLASVSGYTGVKQWTAQAGQKSSAVSLVAGRSYYLEVLHKEGGGGDHVAVGWQPAAGGSITDLPAAQLDVTNPNAAPVAVNDSPSVNEGTPTGIAVLANDSDANAGPVALSITGVGTPSHGTAVISGSSIVYTPAAGYYGSDSFGYTISDGDLSATATVNVTVNDTSSAHDLAGAGLARTNAGGAAGGSRVLADGSWELNATATGLAGTSGSYGFESAAQGGHFDVVLRLKSLAGPSGARAGLMLREGTGTGDRFVAAGITETGSFFWSARSTTGGSVSEAIVSTPLPVLPDAWVMLRRAGDKVRVHVSTDGSSYQEVGVLTLATLGSSVNLGPFAASGSASVGARAVVSGYSVDFVLPASAFAWWQLDENTGTTSYDAFGVRDLTLANGAAWTSTPRNSGTSFDGTDDYLNLGSTDVSGNWSAAMWVKRTGAKTSAALLSSSAAALKLEQWNNTHKVGITRYGVADYSFNYVTPLDTWVHLVFVGTSTQTKLYVNGSLTDTLATGISLPMGNIGRKASGADYLQAQLDDLILFNGALTDVEVSALYAEMQP